MRHLPRSFLPTCLAAIALGALAQPCVAYGGWNYADPHGQTWVVFDDVARVFIPWVLLPYAVMAAASWIWRRSRRNALAVTSLLYLFWVLATLGLYGVMGELGPAHLAYDISVGALMGFFLLFYVRLSLTWWAGRVPAPHPQKVRWAMAALTTIETAVIAGVLLAPMALTPGRIARDGKWKCEIQRHWVSEMIDDYKKDKEVFPKDLNELAESMGADPAVIQCPLTGKPYIYTLNEKTGQYTITCPTPGHGSTKN